MKPNPEYISAWRLQKSSSGGEVSNEPYVYIDPHVAQMCAEEKKEEWTDYTPMQVRVRILNDQEGAVGNDLVTIIKQTALSKIQQRALAKLTPEEKRALNLGHL